MLRYTIYRRVSETFTAEWIDFVLRLVRDVRILREKSWAYFCDFGILGFCDFGPFSL